MGGLQWQGGGQPLNKRGREVEGLTASACLRWLVRGERVNKQAEEVNGALPIAQKCGDLGPLEALQGELRVCAVHKSYIAPRMWRHFDQTGVIVRRAHCLTRMGEVL